MAEIAIIDDEKLLVSSLNLELTESGHVVRPFHFGREFLEYYRHTEPDLVFLDLRLPDCDGLDILAKIKKASPHIPTVIITAHGNMESAIRALKGGAYDYVNKPFDLDEIGIIIEKALKETRLVREVEHRRQRDYKSARLEDFIGESPSVRKLLQTVRKLSAVENTTVLLKGESGTGKDMLAKAIHNLSGRANRQFIEINCASLPENLLESELFGYEKGAFTDARERKTGLVELADKGTLFLDEIGELPLTLQAKLLRFIENRSFRRIGGTAQIKVDVMIISATNLNLEKAMQEGAFRKDLYYRLNVVPLEVPPLRERGGDIMAIAEHYLAHFARKFRKPKAVLSEAAWEGFKRYPWPGNVRELKNLVERLVILCGQIIEFQDLPVSIQNYSPEPDNMAASLPSGYLGLDESLAQVEKELIERALYKAGGVKSDAAGLLGISRYSLLRRLKRVNDILK